MADLTPSVNIESPRQRPLITTTSDKPVLDTPKQNATSTDTKVEDKDTKDSAVAADIKDDKDTGTPEPGHVDLTATDAGEADKADKDDKDKEDTPPWMKREITKARNRQREAENRQAEALENSKRLEQRLDIALKALEKSTGDSASAAKAKSETEDPRPKRESFDNPDAYDSALVDWSARAATKAAAAESKLLADKQAEEDKKAQDTAEQLRQTEELKKAWGAKRTKALEEYPDYVEVAESDDIQISIPMASIIMNAEDGPALAYHLGKHPKEAERISKLQPALAIFEMGRISSKLAEENKPIPSKAPPPVKPVGSRSSAAPKDRTEMSMEEYASVRLPELQQERIGSHRRQKTN